MKTKDLLKLAVIGLKRRMARTLLTVLGVIIGTVCIVLMLAIGVSNYRQFEQNMLSGQSLTEITVNDYSGNAIKGGITDSTVQMIAGIEHVKAVSPVIDIPVTIFAGEYKASLQLKGVDSKVIDVKYAKGGIFSSDIGIPTIVLGANTLQNFVNPENPPNYSNFEVMETYAPDLDLLNTETEFILGYESEDADMPKSQRYRAKISGITEKSYSDSSYYAYIDLDAAKRILMDNIDLAKYYGIKINSYTTLKIIVDDMDNVESVLNEVKKLGYKTYSPTESILQMKDEQSRQQGQLFAIGFISLLISAIGIANTMYANILERKHDIGVMKVIGMKIRSIRKLFLMESALIGIIGGLIGLGISYIVVLIINISAEQTSFLGMYFSEGMKIQIPAWIAIGAVGIALGVGVVSGIYPARKATMMSALEAMRGGN